MSISNEASQLYREFNSRYGFVSISMDVVEDYCRSVGANRLRADLLLDYIISNGLAEECEL